MRPNLRKQMEDIFEGLKYVVVPDDCWEPVEDGWKGDWCYFKKGHTPWNKGKTGTCPEHQKEKNRQMMNERYKNGLDVSGGNNPRAKTWKITYENGKVEIVKGLQPWRIKNGYNKLGLRKLQLKEWKKYRDLVAIEEVSHNSSQG